MGLCVCQFVIMCACECDCVCTYVCGHVQAEVRARSQKRERSIPAALCSLLSLLSRPVAMAAAVKAVSIAKGGSWHPPVTDAPPSSLSVSPRQAPDPLVNLPRGRRSMAQSCRVTVRDDEGENEKERSYTTQMGRRDEKMKR